MTHRPFSRVLPVLAGAAIALSLAGCGGDTGAADPDPCDPMTQPCVYQHTLSTIEVPAGYEDEDICQSWTLNNPTELWVRGVTQINDGGYHHANWFFVPDDQFALPDGTWMCSEHNFSELGAAILGGFLFAMSTQSMAETQTLPAGGAIRIPPYSRVIGASHILNASDVTVATNLRLDIDTVPPSDVAAKLVPARISYVDLSLDPQSKSSFTTECIIDDTYQEMLGVPMKMELYYALSHYHSLGRWAQLEIAGGPRDGEVLFRADGFGENFGQPFDPPFDLVAAGGRGVRFTCGYDNPRNDVVGWGIGDQEMCVLALMSSTDLGWDGRVSEGERVGVAPDGEVQYQGLCDILGVPWNHDKPGGPAR